jgi:hypothetical protein
MNGTILRYWIIMWEGKDFFLEGKYIYWTRKQGKYSRKTAFLSKWHYSLIIITIIIFKSSKDNFFFKFKVSNVGKREKKYFRFCSMVWQKIYIIYNKIYIFVSFLLSRLILLLIYWIIKSWNGTLFLSRILFSYFPSCNSGYW